ncbi:MAG: biopolymer transporter ExbD [Crocinitomicaceae bacterium]|nr:biopolymer transporter ExbD [Crocinitomicaceae bacterium]
MARREIQEINAGSMADIAFLLLIFFLVTTTMEVDAGIGRVLPLKRDNPPQDIEIHDRDILVIKANSNDQLLVEGKRTELEDLEEIVMDFYTINMNGERDKTMPRYTNINVGKCQTEIMRLQEAVEKHPDDVFYKTELENWKTKLALCEELPTGEYKEIAKMAMIRLENQAGTSYGLYIQIQNILKKVVNRLRAERAEEYWGVDYYSLKEGDPADEEIIKKLRILVPERIIEAKIEK